MSQQLEPLYCAQRQRERIGNGLLVPALLFEGVDAAPDVDAVHRGANEVLRERPHQVTCLVGVADEHIDCCEVSPDRLFYPAIAGIDHQRAVLFDDNGRLDDSDGLAGDRGAGLNAR